MTLITLNNTQPTINTHEQQQQQQQQQQPLQRQHRSSSAFIAHLLVQEYPPKVQPQSSSARDKALFSHLDRVDAEAGCILIALANHDKRKDMNDLIPYSIRVIDYDQTKAIGTTDDSVLESLETATGESTTSSISSSSGGSSSDGSIRDGAIRDTENDDLTMDEGDSNRTMSIKNLIYANNESSSSSSDTPALSENRNQSQQTGQQPSLSPSASSVSLSSSSVPALTTPSSSVSLNTQHNDDNDQSKTMSSSKPEPRTDPILLLAAAAKAIDQGANQKRKYSNDDNSTLESRSHSARRPRFTMENQNSLGQSSQSERSKFSHQYLSMRQNPKIMRNAMHAYISYMIYADLASEKMSQHQDQVMTSTTTSYPTHTSSSPHSHHSTNQNHLTYPSSSPSLTSTFNHQHHPYSPPLSHPQQHSSHHYEHSSTRPSEPAPSTNPSAINLGPLHNSIAGNSSIMARPLTAFLRDNVYT